MRLDQIYQGNALAVLKSLPSDSVHCVVTSPPYWGLRDYNIPQSDWPNVSYAPMSGLPEVYIPEMSCCFGLEATIEAYIGHVVSVFREVRRVLRKDGVLFLNLGDAYAGTGGRAKANVTTLHLNYRGGGIKYAGVEKPKQACPENFKPKDMLGIPWRVALALQADGWWLRSDIIWNKTAPMPESVTDRPTKSHEYIFLLSKAKKYFYDHEAVKELSSDNSHPRGSGINKKAVSGWDTGPGPHRTVDHAKKGPKDEIRSEMGLRDSTKFGRGAGWRVKQNPSFSGAVNALVPRRNLRTVWTAEIECVFTWCKWISGQPEFEVLRKRYTDELRNIKDVWKINTEPFPGSHFAVFPQRLVEPCILAGTSEKGCCPECGAPWVRITEKQSLPVNAPQTTASGPEKYSGKHSTTDPQAAGHRILASMKAGREAGYDRNNSFPPRCTIGWKPTCSHDLPPIPCTVLDPFSGSGTVAVVAKKLNRHFVGIEMNPSYISIAWNRLEKEVGLLLLGKEACENREKFEIAKHSQVLQAHS